MSTKRKRYSAEFKLAAIKRMDEVESIAELARELGIRRKFLYLWREQLKTGGEASLKQRPGRPIGKVSEKKQPPAPSAAELRIAQLERLLGQKQAEVDFLKHTFEYVRGAAANRTGDGGKESIAASNAHSRSKGQQH
jgi:transposase-like protein